MRDGRLTRTYIALREAKVYEARHSYGIALIPLGDRTRVLPSFHDAEERESIVYYDRFLTRVSN